MTRKERYRLDATYRAKVNADNRARYYRKSKDPEFLKLHLLRARITNARIAIQHHQERLEFFHDRIQKDLKLLRRLAYWGV